MDVIMKKPTSPEKKRGKKNRTKTSNVEIKNVKIDATETVTKPHITTPGVKSNTKKRSHKENEQTAVVDNEKYPILKNTELVQRFLKVPLTNNQKGRIRQAIKNSLQGTSNEIVPDIVHSKIQAILKSSPNLTDPDLRRIRILYNLLKSSLKGEKIVDESPQEEKPTSLVKAKRKKTDISDGDKKNVDSVIKEKKGQSVKKVKGPKRYVVFLGNLPLDINNEKIMNHFSEMNEHIKNIRIPKIKEDKKSAIAFLELSNEASYEFALSKHHSMMGSKRINVLYTTQKNGKVTKADAKSKSAKLIALQKSGKLVGSLPMAKKRSQRRLKMKRARAQENA